MSKVAVVYWSGTGNTEAMANAIVTGVKKVGHEAELFEVEQFSVAAIAAYDGIAFGCPAMGAEVLEEGTFEPFFTEAESHLQDKPVVLFGSYGWGGGEWMEEWAARTRNVGAKLFSDGLIVENTPGDDEISECEKLGADFANSL